MSNFALDVNTPQGDIISSLNYVLSNLGTFDANLVANIAANVANVTITSANVVTANTVTGQLSSRSAGTLSYIYNYVNVKYANSSTGSSGFTSNSTNATYYGVNNTIDGTISSNPTDYVWYRVTGGFGTTKGLYYSTAGGGQIYFSANTTAPSVRYTPVIDNTAILLQSLANSIVTTTTINPGAVTNVGIATQTIQTDNIGLGVITADLLSANLVIAKDIRADVGIIGDYNSPGYWMQSNTGGARFAGTMSIGNSLTVGNNAVIGNGLSVGSNAVIGNNLGVGNNAVIGNGLSVGSNAVIGNNLFVGNNTQIGGNLVVAGLITAGNLNTNTVSTTVIQNNAVTDTITVGSGTIYTQLGRQLSYVGYDTTTGYYYWADATGIQMPFSSNLITTTANVLNTVSGQLTVSGYVTANVTFGTYVDAVIAKYSYSTGTSTVLAGSVGSKTIPFQIYPGGSLLPLTEYVFPQTIQTITNYGYTANTVPETTRYAWIYKASAITTTYPANVYVYYSNVQSQTLNITNLKR